MRRNNIWAALFAAQFFAMRRDRYESLKNLITIHDELNRIFSELDRAGEGGDLYWYPPVDILDTGDSYVLNAELPGVIKGDVQVHVHENTLVMKGERRFDSICGSGSFYQIESLHGKFRRSFVFPSEIDREGISAELKDGVLTVQIPKNKRQRVQKVQIS